MNFFNKFDKLHNNYKDKKFISLSIFLGIFGIFFVTMGSSFAYITYQGIGTESNKISAGSVMVDFMDESDGITLDKAVPQKDEEALLNNPSHDFKVSNTGNYDIKYKLSFINTCLAGEIIDINNQEVVIDKCIPLEYIKVAISEDGGEYQIKPLNEDGTISLTDLRRLESGSSSISYSLKIWLDLSTPNDYAGLSSTGDVINSIFTGKVEIFGEQMVDVINTADECFEVLDSSIVNYKCYNGNSFGLDSIRYVSIPDQINGTFITSISDSAFYDKNILEVSIPSSITYIASSAFGANEISKIVFLDRSSTQDVIISPDAFPISDFTFEY